MAGFDPQRLVLVQASSGSGAASFGTGFFLTSELVLTASHVLPDEGLSALEVRTEHDGRWRRAELQPIWRDTKLDAVLLRVTEPLGELPDIDWVETDFRADVPWRSSAYPRAAALTVGGQSLWKTAGLRGQVYANAGGGQGAKELELTVDNAPPVEHWAGASGAPIFVGDRLAGFIKEAPTRFDGQRLAGVPALALFQSHGFRQALARDWLGELPQGSWLLVVLAEAEASNLGSWVEGALARDVKAVDAVVGGGLHLKSVVVRICDALESPGHWLRFVTALCAAPIAIFDTTGFEPAMMLALGVRAVVRRGVTIASTADVLDADTLPEPPFNLREIKLVHHGSAYAISDDRHPYKKIPETIKRGWIDLRAQPDYLDLPAYDAVRCSFPALHAGAQARAAAENVLVLCPFGKDYRPNWLHLSNALAQRYADRLPERMLDVASPRLVGQALYEGIRWANTCVADWTGWRANVFFELGVRLACADIGPVGLIEQRAVVKAKSQQQRRLLALFAPTVYKLGNDAEIGSALQTHDQIVARRAVPLAAGALAHDATHRTCLSAFVWREERVIVAPHTLLRSLIETSVGADRQADGRQRVLFSENEAYARELERCTRERWIAAWYYLSQRHPEQRWADDAALRAELRRLANDVLLFGVPASPAPTEPHLVALREQVAAAVERLVALDARAAAPPVSVETPIETVRALKTGAKNQRDRGLAGYPAALTLLEQALKTAQDELAGSTDPQRQAQWAAELCDCFGLVGGVQRRWADSAPSAQRELHLKASIEAYDAGFVYEADPRYGLDSSYNRLNRLIVRLLLRPELLTRDDGPASPGAPPFNVAAELQACADTIRAQLLGARRGDYWAAADLALVELLLGRADAAGAYREFIALAPPDFACASAQVGLRALAELPIAAAPALHDAVALLQGRLQRPAGH